MRCCVEDEGLLALRIRPAEGGSKPPAAALAEDCRGERCRKRRTRCVRWGPGRRNAIYFQRDYAEDGVKPENLTMACSGGAC